LARFGVALSALASTTVGVVASPAVSARAETNGDGCQLGNGVKHVVQITFDNVHFFRDNPNVPSDLELMPHLLQFIKSNGTMLSNNHTPLIAHTATDSLTNYTGLYGDRHGMPVSNSFKTFNPDGTTDTGVSFAYWTDPIFDPLSPPTTGHDINPGMVYSATPPAFKTNNPTNQITPAPWVPYTRAGCSVGDVSTANMVLENTAVDIPNVFGSTSPEAAQLAANPDPFKDTEVADYVGLSVHCAKGDSVCSSAKGVKFGQSTPSKTQVADLLPTEPRGYNGFNALHGHRYIAPQLGAGQANLTHNGYKVTDAGGNLVDLAGNQINGAFLTNHPGFPGFSDISAAQSLAYVADMQETGVPVTYGYISDLHGNHHFLSDTPACKGAPAALPPGDPCYIQQAQAFDASFATFFQRLAKDGITPDNSLFVFTADEGDHVAGANVGRAVQPTPANCDGAKVTGVTITPDVLCTYPADTFGELSTNVTGLLATQKNNKTPFSLHSDSAPQFYVTGKPGPTHPTVRQLEHDVAGLTASNPYSGNSNEKITNYLADPVEQGILHIINADPARTPTFTLFAKPDYFLSPGPQNCNAACVHVDNGFAYNHGDYAAEINTTWLGLVGPGVAHKGVDGLDASEGPNSAGPKSGQVTVPDSGTTGTWADHTDIRPTMLYLVGLKDDYVNDGRVLAEDLTRVSESLKDPSVRALAAAYKQLNASVGRFGTSTLMAATQAIEGSDKAYPSAMDALSQLGAQRDKLATTIKNELTAAAFDHESIEPETTRAQLSAAQELLRAADQLAGMGESDS
jgi:hypothetical protein